MTWNVMRSAPVLSGLAAAVLAACGGGGSSDPAPVVPPAATTVKVSGKALDGPLQGAIACYDLNDNGACDNGEPTSAPSDADGNFSFDVDTAAAGKHRVVVDVPATAVDKDTGAAVGQAYTLVTPATGAAGAQSVVASPLSTLVQVHMDATGATLAAAADFVQSQASLGVSPLADYVNTTGAAAKQAATVAKLLVVATQAQADAVKGAIGTADVSGGTVSAADLKKAVSTAMLNALPAVAASVADPTVANATGDALKTALSNAAAAVVAQSDLTNATAGVAVGAAKLPPDNSAATTTPSVQLTALRYTDANNWFMRTIQNAAADLVLDAAGKVRYTSVYSASEGNNYNGAGTVYSWARGGSRARAGDVHWNGTAWVTCNLGQRSLATLRDAAGRNTSDFCEGYSVNASQRSAVDLTGKSIKTVFADTIRKFPGSESGVPYANWGPSDLNAFGSATFPSGSKLFYHAQTTLKTAFAYDVQASNVLTLYPANIAAGGDARSTPSVACAGTLPAPSAVSTLEDLVARAVGKPCVFNRSGTAPNQSLDPNEWGGNSTVNLGTVTGANALPSGTGTYYSSDALLRVAFTGANNAVTYYNCLRRTSDGSPRNCTAIGTGTYAIQTLGDARVLTFANQPAITQRLSYSRIFVERGGKVYYGFQNLAGGTTNYLRLNTEATQAVVASLQMPPVRPVARASDASTTKAARLATLKGVWLATPATGSAGVVVVRYGDGGRYLLGSARAATSTEQSGAELGWVDLEDAGQLNVLTEVDANQQDGASHTDLGTLATLSDTQLQLKGTGGGTITLSRLETSASGIVGLWALDSATELNTQHFAFFSNGTVMMIDPKGDTDTAGPCFAAKQGPAGGEFASYTYNATTGALRVFAKVYDTNGCAGLFDSSAGAVAGGTANSETNLSVTIAVDGKTAAVAGGGAPHTLYRISNK